MATFDWNDVELTNIIWGEIGESDDHIVPCPNQNEEKHLVLFGDLANKETKIETSGVSPIEQKKPLINANHQVELANNSKYNCDHSPRFGLDSWPDVSDTSVIDVEKSDPDIRGTNESKNVTTSLEGGFSTDETPQFGKGSEYLQNPLEDTEKSDYVHYDWSNIESFDDLDMIFNNDNPIFGDINVGYADESWSSCVDGDSCPSKHTPTSSDSSNFPLGALRSTSDTSNDKPQYKLDLEESFLSVYKKLHGNKSQSQNVQARKTTIEHFVGNSKLLMNEETPGIDEKSPVFPKQLDDCNAATVDSFPVKSVDAATNPPAMTPEEKIEKLRRRQQFRAILAIQKQQQQFGNLVSAENSTIKGGNVDVNENISGFLSLDQNSAIGHDDNNAVTIPLSICSVEESVLRRLQDSISRLDMQIRLCIRDSLFRLAKSAIQRHCPSDTSSANKNVDSHEGFTGIPDVERNTNPIDRIVAHLLFHTPMEYSGELLETPNTPVSATPFYERKPNSSKSLVNGYVPERFESPQVMFPHAPKIPCTNVEKGQSKNA